MKELVLLQGGLAEETLGAVGAHKLPVLLLVLSTRPPGKQSNIFQSCGIGVKNSYSYPNKKEADPDSLFL